jgi:predicted house-cleaning noncanonical NTP pyrophosphatase (MazG superfamily)
MSKIIYNKLIRDKIPEIIIADDKKPKVYTLSQIHYALELKKKMIEEAKELVAADTNEEILNELSDLQELIDSLLELNNVTKNEFLKIQKTKREKRGGFSQRL